MWLGSLVLDALKYVLVDLDKAYSNQLWQAFSQLFSSPVAVLDDPWVQWFSRLSANIALSALPVLIAYHAVRRTVESLDGTEVMPAGVLVRRSVTAGAVLTGVTLYGWFSGTIADYLTQLLGAVPLNMEIIHAFFGLDEHTSTLAALSIAGVFLIGSALVVIQRAILNAEFMVLMIIGAFQALTLVGEDRPVSWQLWKREVVAICITPVLQLLLIFFFTIGLAGLDPSSFSRWLQAFALLYLLWNTPRWARQFTYAAGGSGGIGGSAAGVVTGATRLVVMRRILGR